jgi:hypothetical protein
VKRLLILGPNLMFSACICYLRDNLLDYSIRLSVSFISPRFLWLDLVRESRLAWYQSRGLGFNFLRSLLLCVLIFNYFVVR